MGTPVVLSVVDGYRLDPQLCGYYNNNDNNTSCGAKVGNNCNGKNHINLFNSIIGGTNNEHVVENSMW